MNEHRLALIRNLCTGLAGQARSDKMAYYLAHPEKVNEDIGIKLNGNRRKQKRGEKARRVEVNFRVSTEEYLFIKKAAKDRKVTMTDLLRLSLGLPQTYYKPRSVS